MLETTKYVRKPLYIDAVQVTADNIEEIAAWVNGEVRNDKNGKHVKVKVLHPINPRQTKAFLGDWVLAADLNFKVYTDKAFKKSFEQVSSGETNMHMTSRDEELVK